MSCEECRAALAEAFAARRLTQQLSDTTLPPSLASHLGLCPTCRADARALAAVAQALESDVRSVPAGLVARALAAAAPLVARRTAAWPTVARAVAAALAVVPVALAWDIGVVGTALHVLPVLLPAALAAALVVSYAAGSVLSVALALAAVPVLAACAQSPVVGRNRA